MKKAPETALNPNTDLLNTDTGELNVRYFPGHPKVTRFDAGLGIFTDDEKVPLTKKGDPLTICPVAFRLFTDDILRMGKKRWAEFFYVNEAHILCNLLLHGYSVDELMKLVPKLFYQQANICQVALTIKPFERVSKAEEAKGKKFYICEFSAQRLSEESRQLNELIGASLRIWRDDTLTGDAVTESSRHYRSP
ncbi:MAG: hypothetical protein ABIQ93_08145, partial [Saprospiraceae bacterium]